MRIHNCYWLSADICDHLSEKDTVRTFFNFEVFQTLVTPQLIKRTK